MESDTRTDPDRELEHTGDELEERLERLDDKLGDAREGAKTHAEHAKGDDEDDEGNGESPDPGEFDDPDAEEEEEEDGE